MTDLERKESVYDLVQNDPELRGEVSTARMMDRVSRLFSEALQHSGLNQAELAEIMDVSAGRISQILGEPGNLRISTIVRVLNAAGFDPHVSATSKLDGAMIDGSQNRRKRNRKNKQDEPLTVFTEELPNADPTVAPVKRIIFQNSAISRNTEPGEWKHLGTYRHGTAPKPIRAWTAGGSK